MCDMQGSVTFVNKVLTEQNFRLQFLLHDFSKITPRKNIYLCLAALYINTGVSFKSNITKIYCCWPPILDILFIRKEHLCFGSPHNFSV